MERTKENGFTLLELLVVLVILGLFVAGVLTGRDLIRASELRSVISDLRQLDLATSAFILKYDGFPGDIIRATNYWPGITANGDGNWRIPDSGAREDLRALQQLALAGYIPGEYTGTIDVPTINIEVNVPSSEIDNGGYWMLSYNSTIFGRMGNMIVFGSEDTDTPSKLNGGVVTSEEAWMIDTKMDDDQASSGKLYAVNAYNMTGCVTAPETDPSADYTRNQDNINCRMVFWLD